MELADMDIVNFIQNIPFFPGANERVSNEIYRMKVDMDRVLSTWTVEQLRGVFAGLHGHRYYAEQLEGWCLEEICLNALRVGGLTFLTDAIYLTNFDLAERLRHAKLNVFPYLVSREKFFRPKNKTNRSAQHLQPPMASSNDIGIFDLLRLPPELIEQIMKRSPYKDAQSLAVSCSATNSIYRNSSLKMLLPDIVMVLDFSSGELTTRWWLASDKKRKSIGKLDIMDKENEHKKNQLLNNTTLLYVITSDDFEPEYCDAVRIFVGNRNFKRVVVKGSEYTENVKMMVELFDKDSVELEVHKLTEDYVPFPDIKTISIRENLDTVHSERLFAAKQFINISCAILNVDSFRKALYEWDIGQRQIGRWVILKQFTIFQTPFGQRHRYVNVGGERGYLEFLSELDCSQMAHGEITEYVYRTLP
ncbi:hypothetical protein B9Z55_026242 [Caenorhabditis nigoni]|uniref:F-box domain-containing protein n=1 Tax=Caenorhabditis nigoni TaxID=1611254 RepID=A0A2G5T1V7_9PELO|nr:hypothetical protein B9Z55_026242 [Caenorhabditis nigoni]